MDILLWIVFGGEAAGFIMAVIGAVIVLALYRLVVSRRTL